MKILFTLLALCFALNAHAATYMLLSQTNAFAAGITNEAKAYADTKAPIDSPALTGTPTINGQSIETQLTNKVAKAGDTMSGTLGFSGTATLLNLPSLTTAQKNAATAQAGSQVYDSTLQRVQMYDGAAWHSRVRLDGDTMAGVLVMPNATVISNGVGGFVLKAAANDAVAVRSTNDTDWTTMRSLVYETFSSGGASRTAFLWSQGLNLASGGVVSWSPTSDPNSRDLYLYRDSPATLQLSADAATATPQTIKAHDGSGTDKDGAKLTLEGGQSTGTGIAGALDLATGLSGEASASTANAYSIRYHAKGKYVALTHATTNAIIKFSLPSNKLRGGSITALCYATNSTPHLQALTSEIQFAAVAVGTTITGTISQVDNPLAADSGTLTCAYTLVDNGDNTFYISANPNSSLSSPTERCKLVVTGMSGNAATTITDP